MEDMKYYCCCLKGKSHFHRIETSSGSTSPSWPPHGPAPYILCYAILLSVPHPAGIGNAEGQVKKNIILVLFCSYIPISKS